MSPVLKAVIIANGLAMLLSLLLQLYMSFCHSAIAPGPTALGSFAAAGLHVFCPRRLLFAAAHRVHQVELIKLQLHQNNPNSIPETLAGHVDSPNTIIHHVNTPQLSNSSDSPDTDHHKQQQQQQQQQQDLDVGSASRLHHNQDTEDQDKRYVPAGPNPLHNR